MPSTTSSSLSSDLPSSTVMTPSLPTLSIASAMILPIDSSAFAEIAPTWLISLLVVVGLLAFLLVFLVGGGRFVGFLKFSAQGIEAFSVPALEVHRVHAGGHVLHAFAD